MNSILYSPISFIYRSCSLIPVDPGYLSIYLLLIMPFALKIATLLGAFAGHALAHGWVSGIVANNAYTAGWQVSYYYDIVNKVPIPQTPGWYEEALDLGFVPPHEYQCVAICIGTVYVKVDART